MGPETGTFSLCVLYNISQLNSSWDGCIAVIWRHGGGGLFFRFCYNGVVYGVLVVTMCGFICWCVAWDSWIVWCVAWDSWIVWCVAWDSRIVWCVAWDSGIVWCVSDYCVLFSEGDELMWF